MEPWLVPVGFAIRAQELGVEVLTGRKVVAVTRTAPTSPSKPGHWTIRTRATDWPEVCSSGRSAAGSLLVTSTPKLESVEHSACSSPEDCGELSATVVINCAGRPPNPAQWCIFLVLQILYGC